MTDAGNGMARAGTAVAAAAAAMAGADLMSEPGVGRALSRMSERTEVLGVKVDPSLVTVRGAGAFSGTGVASLLLLYSDGCGSYVRRETVRVAFEGRFVDGVARVGRARLARAAEPLRRAA